jgi:hypothetical protein
MSAWDGYDGRISDVTPEVVPPSKLSEEAERKERLLHVQSSAIGSTSTGSSEASSGEMLTTSGRSLLLYCSYSSTSISGPASCKPGSSKPKSASESIIRVGWFSAYVVHADCGKKGEGRRALVEDAQSLNMWKGPLTEAASRNSSLSSRRFGRKGA